ncbi:hypothetical protein Hanom_Chr11g01035691 [Helianthus anomalus]
MSPPSITNPAAAPSHPVGRDVDSVPEQPEGRRCKSTAARRKSKRTPISLPSKKYEPFTGPKIKLKTSADNLVILVNNLNAAQKKKVVEMGNYDDVTGMLNVGEHRIWVIAELVHKIFGIPIGDTEIVEKIRARDNNPVVKEWRSQFKDCTKVSPIGLKDMMVSDTSSDRLFKLNWLVLFNSVVGEISTNTVNQRFLGCVDPTIDITSFDWCN